MGVFLSAPVASCCYTLKFIPVPREFRIKTPVMAAFTDGTSLN